MEWADAFTAERQPTKAEIEAYIDSSLWAELNRFLQESYEVEPAYSYSSCSAQPGWNVKYKKAGRSLCTLYPMQGFFIALVTIGAKEEDEAQLLMPMCSEYTQTLFTNTTFSAGGRWLMINVTDDSILQDVKQLIQLRRKIKRKA